MNRNNHLRRGNLLPGRHSAVAGALWGWLFLNKDTDSNSQKVRQITRPSENFIFDISMLSNKSF